MNYEAIKQLQIKVSRSSKIPKPIWNPLHAQFSFKKRCIQSLFFSLLDLGTSTDVYYATQAVWRHLLFALKQVPSCFTCLFATLFCCKAPEKVLWTTKPHLNFQTEFLFLFLDERILLINCFRTCGVAAIPTVRTLSPFSASKVQTNNEIILIVSHFFFQPLPDRCRCECVCGAPQR